MSDSGPSLSAKTQPSGMMPERRGKYQNGNQKAGPMLIVVMASFVEVFPSLRISLERRNAQ